MSDFQRRSPLIVPFPTPRARRPRFGALVALLALSSSMLLAAFGTVQGDVLPYPCLLLALLLGG